MSSTLVHQKLTQSPVKVVKKKVKKVKRVITEEKHEEEPLGSQFLTHSSFACDETSNEQQTKTIKKVVKKRKVAKRKIEPESELELQPIVVTDVNTNTNTNTSEFKDTYKDSIDIIEKKEPKLFLRQAYVNVGSGGCSKSYWSLKLYEYVYLSDYNLQGICRRCYYSASFGVHFLNMLVKYPIKRFIKEYHHEIEIINQAKHYNLKDVYMFFTFMKREDLYKYFLELKLKKCYVIDLTLNYATGELDFEEIYKHGLQKPMRVFVMNEERLKQWSTLPLEYISGTTI